VFNYLFEKLTGRYTSFLEKIVTLRLVTIVVLGAFVFGTFFINKTLPAGFIPGEDQGQIYAIIQTPPGSTLEATNKVARALQQAAEKIDGIVVCLVTGWL